MKFKKTVTILLLGMILVFNLAGVVQAGVSQQDVPEDPDEVVQLVLVLDVSQSMEELILTEDMPAKLFALKEQIQAVQDDPVLAEVNEQIRAVSEDPEVNAAEQAWKDTIVPLDEWLSSNGYAESLAAVREQLGQKLLELGCLNYYTSQMATAATFDELDFLITTSCEGVNISFDDRQALRDMMPYLGVAEYYPLQKAAQEAYFAYVEVLESLNYNELIAQRNQLVLNSNIVALEQQMSQMVEEYGVMRKIDLAKLAAKSLIELSRLDTLAGRRASTIALVRFSDDALLVQDLTYDFDAVEAKIDGLETILKTNVYASLDEALKELERNADPEQPIVIILLSDGHITIGPQTDQVLDEIPPRANEMDATICTVGFGETEAHVDKILLRGLAHKTDGQYMFAERGEELVNFFLACRQGIVGEVQQVGGYVSYNQPVTIDPIDVYWDVCELSMALNFVAGNPNMQILDPDGNTVDANYPDFTLQSGSNLKLYTILNPEPGEWHLSVNSDQAEDENILYNIVITNNVCVERTPTPVYTPTPTPEPTPIPTSYYVDQAMPVIPLVVLVIIVMGIFIIITRRKE